MCGRLACGLRPQDVCNSCCYKTPGTSSYVRPQWKDVSDSKKTYEPSYNICPTEVAPVLLSGRHFDSDGRVVAPMVFGLIPSWSKTGEASRYSTINCKIETVKTSKLYGNLLRRGQRCVVICNGFHEWKQEQHGSKKNPYFVHLEQPSNVLVCEPHTWNLEFTAENGFKGFRTMKLAALFERTLVMDVVTYSFTIITKEANSEMSWLHARMPAILETDEQVGIWLNPEEFDADSALDCLSSDANVVYFPILNLVNKVVNKDVACIQYNLNSGGKDLRNQSSSRSFLRQWLEKGQKRESDEPQASVAEKKKKK